jgi:hypothetical protein
VVGFGEKWPPPKSIRSRRAVPRRYMRRSLRDEVRPKLDEGIRWRMGAADGPLAGPFRPRGLLARRHSRRLIYGGRRSRASSQDGSWRATASTHDMGRLLRRSRSSLRPARYPLRQLYVRRAAGSNNPLTLSRRRGRLEAWPGIDIGAGTLSRSCYVGYSPAARSECVACVRGGARAAGRADLEIGGHLMSAW